MQERQSNTGPAPQTQAADQARAEIGAPAGATTAAPSLGARRLVSLQRHAGNRAVSGLMGKPGATVQRLTLQRDPPPTQAELDSVVDLLPLMPALDALVSGVEADCAQWSAWRGTLKGAMPGPGAFSAMTQFKESVRAKGADWTDPALQKAARGRLSADNKQLLTEMCSFALGSSTRSGGDYSALSGLFGVQTKALTHKYTLKIGYSIQVKGKLGIGVGYTYRSAGIFYSNDFGMTYNKPINMRSGGISAGPSAGLKIKGKGLDLPATGSVGLEGEGKTESLLFWMPDDFETSFSVVKVGAAAALGVKGEAKVLELLRVSSDKHPPLLFDLMGGQTISTEVGAELSAEIGAGVDVELGVMVGGADVGATTVGAPALEEAKKNADKAGLTSPNPREPTWEVVGTAVIPFATGKDFPTEPATVSAFARQAAAWAKANPGAEMRFELVGQASPRWRHPKKGEVSADLNQRLSQSRAEWVKVLLGNDLDAGGAPDCPIGASGCAGPVLELDDDRAQARGTGSLKGLAETRDPENDDAAYRVVSITGWGKKAPEPVPATPPPLR